MNVIQNIQQAVNLLKEIEDYNEELNGPDGLISVCDQKIDYWEHYLENEPLKITETYNICREIKAQRMLRRKYKNDAELIKIFKDNEQKMSNVHYRSILISQIYKTHKKHQEATYNYDAYSKEEALDILGIGKEEEKNNEDNSI